jgi:site-specific DNA-cytosine methylase
MKVLIGCEYSGVVRDEFIRQGHNAVSVDIIDTDKPGPHIISDILAVLDQDWDLIIAFPPCTHLAGSGARWFKDKQKEQEEALSFVRKIMEAPCDKICIENPVGVISTKIRKPDQIVQPWMFGDPYEKRTCLWLKGLPKLEATNTVQPEERHVTKSGRSLPTWYNIPPSVKDRGKIRSKTFLGLAKAMAEQWG